MTDERSKDGWTLWREIYGTIIGALAVVVPLVVFGANYVSKYVDRIEAHESKITAIEKIDNMREAARVERAGELNSQLRDMKDSQLRIEATLQRLIERPR